MAKRILSVSVLAVFAVLVLFSASNAQNKNLHKPYPVINITGDEPANPDSKRFTGDIDAVLNLQPYTTEYADSIITITDVFTGQTTLYDYVSNSVPQHIVQTNAYTFQMVFMKNMTPGIPSSNRRCVYMVSTNTGASWTYLGEVFSVSSGYPCIDQFSDGTAVIGGHAAYMGLSSHNVIAYDLAPLIGVFSICDPNYMPGSGIGVWTRIVTTAAGKVSFIGSINGAPDPNTYSNVLNNSIGCTFNGWNPLADVENAEGYSIAKAENGTIGLAYIRRGDIITSNLGDVRFMESTNDGVTWEPPITIYDAQPNSSNFIGGLRGIDLVYTGNIPKVVFDLIWQNDAGGYYPDLCSKFMFWSPNINGGSPVVIADSTNSPWHPVVGLINDGFTPICRGTIGRSEDNTALICTYCVSRAEVFPSIDGDNYFDVYLAWSYNGGASWYGREKLTNFSGPLRDCRYPNLAPVNDVGGYYYFANIEYLNDSIPGSAVHGAIESPAQQHFMRVRFPGPEGVINTGDLPERFSLSQNYPNPFNPVTQIKFSVSKSVFVALTVYDAAGKEITKLVNENKNTGEYKVVWNAESYPSGVYFYKLEAGNYAITKKMVLIK